MATKNEGGGWPASVNTQLFPRGHPALKEEPMPAPQNSATKVSAKPPEQWPIRRHVRDSKRTPVGGGDFVPGC